MTPASQSDLSGSCPSCKNRCRLAVVDPGVDADIRAVPRHRAPGSPACCVIRSAASPFSVRVRSRRGAFDSARRVFQIALFHRGGPRCLSAHFSTASYSPMIPASLENTHECANDNEDNIHQRTLHCGDDCWGDQIGTFAGRAQSGGAPAWLVGRGPSRAWQARQHFQEARARP
jgi:hypothetical protein